MDLQEVLQRVDLQDLAEQAGAQFRGKRARCVLHNGDNPTAFGLYERDGIARWHCYTGCPEGQNDGNALDFYMRWHKVDFRTALVELARQVGVTPGERRLPAGRVAREAPALVKAPVPAQSAVWEMRARAFVDYASGQLWGAGGAAARAYLQGRGLTEETMRGWGLGFNPGAVWDKAESWGLSDKRVWLPRGIVIPHERDGAVRFVNIRRLPDAEPKYAGPRGGRRGLYVINYLRGWPVLVVVEGEFDCMVAAQVAGDLCDVTTLGGARAQVDTVDGLLLARAWRILVVLDDDVAGVKGAGYWRELAPGRVEVVAPPAHDLTAYVQARGDLRRWLAGQVAPRWERLLTRWCEERQYDDFVVRYAEVLARASDAR